MNEKGRMPTWGQMVEQLRKQRYRPSVYLFPHRLIFVIRQQTTPRAYLWRNNTEREMISGRKQPQIKSIEETEAPQKHQQFWVIFVLGEQIFVMEQQIFGKRQQIFGRWTCQQQRDLDVWKRKKLPLSESEKRRQLFKSVFSECGFMWIYSWKTTHSWKTSYLIWLEVQ